MLSSPLPQLTLSSNLLGLGTGHAHHDGAVGHGLEDEGDESGTGTSKRGAGVKVLLVEEAAAAAGREDGEDEGALLVVCDGGDNRHALADLRVR